jgi:hypothetical protein
VARLDSFAYTLAADMGHAGRSAAAVMLLTCAIGGWTSAVMHGSRRDRDDLPAGQGRPKHDD